MKTKIIGCIMAVSPIIAVLVYAASFVGIWDTLFVFTGTALFCLVIWKGINLVLNK